MRTPRDKHESEQRENTQAEASLRAAEQSAVNQITNALIAIPPESRSRVVHSVIILLGLDNQ